MLKEKVFKVLEKPKPKQPLQINCFPCKKLITVKYVNRSSGYSQKNNWGYWIEKEDYKDRYICDDCLLKLYKQCKWEFQKLLNKKKQNLLRQYIIDGTINGKIKPVYMPDEYYNEKELSSSSKKKKKQ